MDKRLAKTSVRAYLHLMDSKRKFIKTRFRGVYFRESLTRVHNGKPDRCFSVWYTGAHGKGHWYTVGWASEGFTDKYANGKRQELLLQAERGQDPVKRTRISVGDAVNAYSVWARDEGKSIDKEISRYNKHMHAPLAALPIESITAGQLTSIKADLLTRLAPGTVHHCFSFVRRAINHAISNELHDGANPVTSGKSGKFRMPRVQNSGVRFFTPQEAQRLLAELAKSPRQTHDMSLLSLKTGLRLTEIFSIMGQDILPEANLIHFTAKGGKRECVHAPKDIVDMLLSYGRRPGEYIFQGENGGKMANGLSRTFERAVKRLGFNTGITDNRQKVWFHTWRHTFASWLAQSGEATLHEIKEMMRHESIEMTERYAHLIPGHQAEKLSIIEKTLQRTSP